MPARTAVQASCGEKHTEKGYYITMYRSTKCFFCTFARFSPAPVGLFSRSRLRGTQGVACTPRREFVSQAGSVARALGVRSREIWQVIMGLHSASLSPARQWKTHMSAVLLHCCKISLLCGSHGTRAVAHQVGWTTSMRVLT